MSYTSFPQQSPVRIYVLWHPDFDALGRVIARRIYHWFRLETMEGIPVFFRSVNAPGREEPPPIDGDCPINYIIPLIEANMVADPVWRRYVARYGPIPGPADAEAKFRLFPVALDEVAYQMPQALRRLNFIRHNLNDKVAPDVENLIGQLTEVICRDLRGGMDSTRASRAQKLKIFLSHAKADGTDAPVMLKEYIQGRTQCEAFFDETDIASGYDYAEVLEQAIREDSAGLIVVQGDHYADRPWCRKEIRDFLKPVPEHHQDSEEGSARADCAPCFFIPPVVVVYNMEGKKIGRTIPELGHAPCLRWQDGHQRLIVTTLLREILLGLFYRIMARGVGRSIQERGYVVINRTPDPVMVDRILHVLNLPDNVRKVIVHPGYGLSQMEKDGLLETFPRLRFTAFSELGSSSAEPPGEEGPNADASSQTPEASAPRLSDVVIGVSAGDATDILCAGMGDEHNRELLVRLLRPLFRSGASLLYGGALPSAERQLSPWETPVNFTGAFMDLLLSERGRKSKSRLYNLSAWPFCKAITKSVVARWTDTCSFITVTQAVAGIAGEHWEDKVDAEPAPRQLANQSRCLSRMREMAAGSIQCVLPDDPAEKQFSTLAHIFVGGRTQLSAGRMPGVLEEILCMLDAGKPMFIIGGTQGAAGLAARWFLNPEHARIRPRELNVEHYAQHKNFGTINGELAKEGLEQADGAFDRLWDHIKRANDARDLANVFHNGLTHDENTALLTNRSFAEITVLVTKGIDALVDGREKVKFGPGSKAG